MTAANQHAALTLPSNNQLGQATAIEQSRAAAEVHAAVLIAQQCPRDMQAAIAEMRSSCQQTALAERAFYAFPRGGETVSGPSVYLARELARCWGNVQYGVAELRRDDVAGESEMQAFAWDVQANTRNSAIFIVPHRRDTKKGVKALVDMRDVYENNANNGARRVRESIFNILPVWFVEEAKTLCHKTLKAGGGEPLAKRIANIIKAFADIGVSSEQLERKLDRPNGKWTEHDVAQLRILGSSLSRNEITVEDAFPSERVTVAEIVPPSGPAQVEAEVALETAAEAPVDQASTPQLTKLHTSLTTLGVTNQDARRDAVSVLVGRTLASSKELTKEEASMVIEMLGRLEQDDEPAKALAAVLAELRDQDQAASS